MFKDKNFGLPKDLIESARSVMEKQLVEYNEDDYIDNPPKGMDKGTREARKKAADMGLKGPHLEREGIIKKPTVKKPATTSSDNLPENHVVKFTFYLKENFHINELTEEEIAWIYENEYVQWLEETTRPKTVPPPPTRNPNNRPKTVEDILDGLGYGITKTSGEKGSESYTVFPTINQKQENQRKAEEILDGLGYKITKTPNRYGGEEYTVFPRLNQKQENKRKVAGNDNTSPSGESGAKRGISREPGASKPPSRPRTITSAARPRTITPPTTPTPITSAARPRTITPPTTPTPITSAASTPPPKVAIPNYNVVAGRDELDNPPPSGESGATPPPKVAIPNYNVVAGRDELDNTSPSGESGATPRPEAQTGASARRKTDSDSSGPSRSQSFTSYRKSLGLGGDLKSAQSEPYKRAYERYRKAKTPEKPFSQRAYGPGGVFGDKD